MVTVEELLAQSTDYSHLENQQLLAARLPASNLCLSSGIDTGPINIAIISKSAAPRLQPVDRSQRRSRGLATLPATCYTTLPRVVEMLFARHVRLLLEGVTILSEPSELSTGLSCLTPQSAAVLFSCHLSVGAEFKFVEKPTSSLGSLPLHLRLRKHLRSCASKTSEYRSVQVASVFICTPAVRSFTLQISDCTYLT